MSIRKWLCVSLILLFSIFALIALTVYLVDPLQVYRMARFFLPPIDNTTQVYSNAGIARSYDYDSAIVGTSVTENFKPSELSSHLGGSFIKLCTAGGNARNHKVLMDLAFRTHHIRRIVFGLDIYSFIGSADTPKVPLPMYLYNDNPFDDVNYFLNRSILGSFLPRCLSTLGQSQDPSLRDSMYSWAGRDPYGPDAVLYYAEFTPPVVNPQAEEYPAQSIQNLEQNLLPLIRENPDTRFDIFLPPYNATEWSTMKSRGSLEAMLKVRELCCDALLGLPNVHLYDFSARTDWVLNLDNYKDTTHYGEWINSAIIRSIAAEENLVTSREEFLNHSRLLALWAELLMEARTWREDLPIE